MPEPPCPVWEGIKKKLIWSTQSRLAPHMLMKRLDLDGTMLLDLSCHQVGWLSMHCGSEESWCTSRQNVHADVKHQHTLDGTDLVNWHILGTSMYGSQHVSCSGIYCDIMDWDGWQIWHSTLVFRGVRGSWEGWYTNNM